MEAVIKRKILSIVKNRFETEQIKEYFLDMGEHIPDYFFTMPASTSGKFHNSKQCEDFGQLYHVFMFSSIMEHRLRLKGNKEKYNTPEIRDCMRCVPFFHDAVKCGWNGSRHTVPDHPMLAAQWVRDTIVEHDISAEYKEMIACMCEAHSGEWNTNRSGKPIMPEPRSDMEFFVHECDILSSRNDIDMILPKELISILEKNLSSIKEEITDINEYILPFGKYSGRLLIDIAKTDRSYIAWAKQNLTQEPLKTLLSQL